MILRQLPRCCCSSSSSSSSSSASLRGLAHTTVNRNFGLWRNNLSAKIFRRPGCDEDNNNNPDSSSLLASVLSSFFLAPPSLQLAPEFAAQSSSPQQQLQQQIEKQQRNHGPLSALKDLHIFFMAGHSKWNNIKHRKAAADEKRARIFVKLSRYIQSSVKTGPGGADLSVNHKLAAAIEKAKQNNMPKANIDKAIKTALGGTGENWEAISYEGIGPGGVAIIVDALTDNRKRTAPVMRSTFNKNGGVLGNEGSNSWLFTRKGVLEFENLDTARVDELMELAIEHGADDVETEEDPDNPNLTHVQIVCAPSLVGRLRIVLEEKQFVPTNVDASRPEPNKETLMRVIVGSETEKQLLALIDALEENDDVQNVYTNATFVQE